MFRCHPVSLALIGSFVWLTGCTSYTQIDDVEMAGRGRMVRVTTTDGKERDFYEPRIEADSIKGRLRSDSEVVFAVPLDQVAELAVKDTDVLATVGLVTLVVAIPVAIALISMHSAMSEPGY